MLKYVTSLVLCVILFSGIQGQETKWLIGSNGLMALCDKDGTPVTEFEYGMINDIHDEMAAVSKSGKWGFINTDGKMVIKNKYYEVMYFSNSLCPVSKKLNEWYFIDKKGKKALKQKFQYAMPFASGLAPVKIEGRWGFINTQGDIVIPAIYESANIFSEGLAAIRNNGLWGYLNSSGRLVIPFIFEQANSFIAGKARVNKDGHWYYIDKTGKNLGLITIESNEMKVYKLADKMPVFPGGYNALFDYIKKNLQYPELEKEKGVQGTVRVAIIVDTTGTITHIKIADGLTANFDREAMRLIKTMPKWEPGIIDNKKVNVQILLNVEFKLEDN